MIYYGPVSIDHSSYGEWKMHTYGNGYNFDQSFGCQCWDFAAQYWYNIGFPSGYPLTGPNISAYEVWTVSREANAGSAFDLIYDKTQILQGDVIVLNGTSSNPAGHIAFADEDYNGTNYIRCLGQNQGGGEPTPGGGTTVSLNSLGLGDFLGAFRYKEWHQPIPPHPTVTKSKFKWVLYARKLRNSRYNTNYAII